MADQNASYSAELKSAQNHLRQENFESCLQVLRTILNEAPDHVDALYILAVTHRYAKDYKAAKETLSHLKTIVPDFGRAYQEEAYIYRDHGETDKSLMAFQKACAANSGLQASWKAQADILDAKGHTVAAANARGYYERLMALPRDLHAVTNLIYEGKLFKAEDLCKRYMRTDKTNVEGMRLLADIAGRLGANAEAEFLLTTALELAPNNIMVRFSYVELLRKMQKFVMAVEQAKLLYDRHPENVMLQSSYAIQSLQVADYETALGLFESVLKTLPNDPHTLTSRGHAYKTMGRQDEAIASYQQACLAKPDHGDAYFSLANLKTYRFSYDEVMVMQNMESRGGLSLQDQAHFCFSLGKAYEDRKDFARAFDYYDSGNEAKRIQSRYDADKMSEDLQAQINICTSELFEKRQGTGHDAPDPIFILGLPRAGSTLLEQILASHSQIDGTLELPNILALAHKLRGRRNIDGESDYPQNLHDLPPETLKEFGKTFIEDTHIHRKEAPFFIDKMPNNFRHIGLIHLILPNAKIIDARRHPMACCFSGFKQHFAEGQEFTYGLKQIGQYYRDYVELMDHWDAVFPGKVLRVQYEDVVADTETQVRRMLDHLGLPFEQGCVDFHKTERSVRTASSEQVRQPIYKSGLEQWRHFEPWLDPLKDALGPVLERYPID